LLEKRWLSGTYPKFNTIFPSHLSIFSNNK
jgi:hypothetical protein